MALFGFGKKATLPAPEQALPGRSETLPVPERHFVNGHPLKAPFPAGMEQAVFGLGCFWGAERKFWQQEGVYSTAVGYAAGITPNPNYREVCSGMTGHNEVVLVVFDPTVVSYEQLLKVFFESHNPTQGMQPGQRQRHPISLRHLCLLARAKAGGRASPRPLPDAAQPSRLRQNHHRNSGRAGVLLRRRIPPAVSGQKSLAATVVSAAPTSASRMRLARSCPRFRLG